MRIFYRDTEDFDSPIVNGSSLKDIDPDAIKFYRSLKAKTDNEATELTYHNIDLMHSLRCVVEDGGEWRLTYAGLLVLGSGLLIGD